MSENETSAENQQERLIQAGWIVGFVDGEGYFGVSINKNSKTKFGFQILPEFVVTQGAKSVSSLEFIKEYFGCGRIFINRRHDNHREPLYRYCVRNLHDLSTIIVPFFNRFPMKTAKQLDFVRFSHVIDQMLKKEHFSFEGIEKIAGQIGKKLDKNPQRLHVRLPETG
jgi:hypothetical protein